MADIKPYYHKNNQRLSEKDVIEYVLQRFQDVKHSKNINNMIEFHTFNKYMIMAHDQDELKMLGNMVAMYKKKSLSNILENYENHLIYAISKTPTIKTHSNVIMHIFGYFLKYLNQSEKRLFLDKLEQFKENKIALGKILLEISPIAYHYDRTYLASQTYFLLYSDRDPKVTFQPINIKEHE